MMISSSDLGLGGTGDSLPIEGPEVALGGSGRPVNDCRISPQAVLQPTFESRVFSLNAIDRFFSTGTLVARATLTDIWLSTPHIFLQIKAHRTSNTGPLLVTPPMRMDSNTYLMEKAASQRRGEIVRE